MRVLLLGVSPAIAGVIAGLLVNIAVSEYPTTTFKEMWWSTSVTVDNKATIHPFRTRLFHIWNIPEPLGGYTVTAALLSRLTLPVEQRDALLALNGLGRTLRVCGHALVQLKDLVRLGLIMVKRS